MAERRRAEPGAAGAAEDAESGKAGEDTAAALRALDVMLARGLMSREEHGRRAAEIRAAGKGD
jgi:hypothetical protein